MPIITGLDLSLTATGIVRAEVGAHDPRVLTALVGSDAVCGVRVPVGQPTLAGRSSRLRRLAGAIYDHAKGSDLVVIEAPAYSRNSGSAHDRAGLWWLTVGRLTGTGHNVVEIENNTLKVYGTGKGNVDKDVVLAAVIKRYPDVDVQNNNVADALCAAAMGCRFSGHPIEPSLPETHVRAMKAPKWAPTT